MNWRVGVAGSPVAHSLSPQLHEIGLRAAGLTGTSTRVEIDLEHAGELRHLLGTAFDALSITSPLKAAAFEMCDEPSESALRTRSVNSLLVRDGLVQGQSTDGEGFIEALRATFGEVVDNAHAVVLGAGGAASAIVDALVAHGVQSVVVHGRTPSKVEALVERYANVHSWSLVYRPVDLIVNTIPEGARDAEATVLQGVHLDTVAVDIVYDPRETEWRRRYRDAGCRTVNGLPMLAYQAALQMRWWWGVALDGSQIVRELQ
ncbi:MAG TPA: shikimate dehydrogenase [Acidimicrobiales bacterium]|nr:shikimate dehydrogenase [Acidimicrobiales bacterium]